MKNKPLSQMSVKELERYKEHLHNQLAKIEKYRLILEPVIWYDRQKNFFRMFKMGKRHGKAYWRKLKTKKVNGKVIPLKSFADKIQYDDSDYSYWFPYRGTL